MVKEDAFVPPKKDDAVAPQRKRIAKTVSPKRKKNQRSRSSTMPGFTTASDRQRAYRDGIRAYEGRTGRKLEETPEKETKRRKANGEAMYKNSASVPDSMVQFAEEIHQEERISRKEEIELGERTQEAIRLQNLFDVLESKLGREPTDGEWCAAAGKINMEAINEAIEEGLEAKNKLVTSNLRMVQSVVNTYIRNGLSAQYNAGDMMQDGILALIRAAEKFEPDRGWKFSTYAMYWVRASVKRSQISQSRIVNTPQRLYENHKRLLRVQRELMADLGRPPTRKELSEAVGMSELQVNRCITAMEQRFFSLDSEVNNRKKPNDSNKDTLVDILEAKIVDDEYSNLNRIYLREDLIETLNRHLPPEAVEILMLRYGLKDPPDPDGVFRQGKQVTIAELSRLFGLKPDKIRRIIENSLKQLKGLGTEEWLAFERELQ
jgi:RNA polymerase primary sigma factor